MAALNLFPARIPFVNADGTLTPEAYRALQVVFSRVGGALGDVGVDTFNDQTTMGQASDNPAITDMTVQPQSEARLISDVIQQHVSLDVFYQDISQPTNQDMQLPDITQPTANGINTTITTALLVGKTITIQNGIVIGFA